MPRRRSLSDPAGRYVVETAADRLAFDRRSGRLVSLRHRARPRTELIASQPGDPVVEVGFLDADRRFSSVDDRSAGSVDVPLDGDADDWRVTTRASGLGGLALDALVTVRGGPGD